jgi:hypothetical protein
MPTASASRRERSPDDPVQPVEEPCPSGLREEIRRTLQQDIRRQVTCVTLNALSSRMASPHATG